MKNIDKGLSGEDYVFNILKSKGYNILCRNFRCNIGEIDIIYKRKNYIVFGEIKTRYSNRFGTPGEAVNYRKQQKIKKVALYYIQKNKILDYFFTFDVIELIYDYNKSDYNLNIIENAF